MMKRFCKNIAPNNPPAPHPVMSGGYSIFCRALVALVIIFAFVSSVHAAWYSDRHWLYRKKLTIDGSMFVGGPHSNFPVLVSLTDPDLASYARPDGLDILFTSSNGTSKLDHEIGILAAGSYIDKAGLGC